MYNPGFCQSVCYAGEPFIISRTGFNDRIACVLTPASLGAQAVMPVRTDHLIIPLASGQDAFFGVRAEQDHQFGGFPFPGRTRTILFHRTRIIDLEFQSKRILARCLEKSQKGSSLLLTHASQQPLAYMSREHICPSISSFLFLAQAKYLEPTGTSRSIRVLSQRPNSLLKTPIPDSHFR